MRKMPLNLITRFKQPVDPPSLVNILSRAINSLGRKWDLFDVCVGQIGVIRTTEENVTLRFIGSATFSRGHDWNSGVICKIIQFDNPTPLYPAYNAIFYDAKPNLMGPDRKTYLRDVRLVKRAIEDAYNNS